MKTVQEYAIELVVDGARHMAEDDTNEDGDIAFDDHEEACRLAERMARAIAANPQVLFDLAAKHQD